MTSALLGTVTARDQRGRPSGVGRVPVSNSAISSAIGRASRVRWSSVSYQASKICRKIHCVQR